MRPFVLHTWINVELCNVCNEILFFLFLWCTGKRCNCNFQNLCLKGRGHGLRHFLCPLIVVPVKAFPNCLSKRMGCLKDKRNRWLWEFLLYIPMGQDCAITLANIHLVLHLWIYTFSEGSSHITTLFIFDIQEAAWSFSKALSFMGNW